LAFLGYTLSIIRHTLALAGAQKRIDSAEDRFIRSQMAFID